MRIAVAYHKGSISRYFDRTEQFKIYDVFDGKVVATVEEHICGYGHGMLACFLQDQCINMLICGHIEPDAKAALTMAGITIHSDVQGDADSAVEQRI